MAKETWISIEEALLAFHVTTKELSRDKEEGELDSRTMTIGGKGYLHFRDDQLDAKYERRLKRNDLMEVSGKAIVGAASSAPIALATIVGAGMISRTLQDGNDEEQKDDNEEQGQLEEQTDVKGKSVVKSGSLVNRLSKEPNSVQLVLADDELELSEMIKRIYSESEFRFPLHVTNDLNDLEDALLGSSHTIGAVILFLDLSWATKMSYDVMRRLSEQSMSNVFIIAYSRSVNQDDVNLSYKAGANLFLHKGSTHKETKRNFLETIRLVADSRSGVILPKKGPHD